MTSSLTRQFSHRELSLLLFALDGGNQADASCELDCPIVEETGPPEVRLRRHLNNHFREGLVETGAMEMLANVTGKDALRPEPRIPEINDVNRRLRLWSCSIRLEGSDLRLLLESVSRLPRTAWFSMPLTLWRLKRKLTVQDPAQP